MKSLLTTTQLLTLVALLRCPLHAYAIRQEIIEATGRQAFPARTSLQRAIKSLLAAGYIEYCHSDPTYWLKARRGIPIELTPAGRKRVERELKTYLAMIKYSKIWIERYNALQAKQRGLPYDKLLLARYPLPRR